MVLLIIAAPGVGSYLLGAEGGGAGRRGPSWGLYLGEHFASPL